jgi:hypothetical protein
MKRYFTLTPMTPIIFQGYAGKSARNTNAKMPPKTNPIIHFNRVSSPEIRVSKRSILASMPSRRRSSLIKSVCVASCESKVSANTPYKASDSALACASEIPAALSFSTNFSVSNVIAAIVVPSEFDITSSLPCC